MSPHRQEVTNVAKQAADWLRIMQTSELQDDEGFLSWLKQSPLHVREFLLAYRMDEKLDRVDPTGQIDVEALTRRISSNVLPIGAHMGNAALGAAPKPAAAPRSRKWAVAASIAFVMLAIPAAYFGKRFNDTYTTNVGEQRSLVLDDGSVVYLDTDSKMRVSFNKRSRDIHLQDGRVLFEVRHDATRPFRVHAADSVIRAVGTQFAVRRFPEQVTVAVVEGTVEVGPSSDSPARTPAMLNAGQSATIDAIGQISPPAPIDPEVAMAWRKQQLVFEQAPLSQIVAEFNRYNLSPQLRIEESEIANRRFNGVFDAWHPESLLLYLSQQNDALTFDRTGDEITIRREHQPVSN